MAQNKCNSRKKMKMYPGGLEPRTYLLQEGGATIEPMVHSRYLLRPFNYMLKQANFSFCVTAPHHALVRIQLGASFSYFSAAGFVHSISM